MTKKIIGLGIFITIVLLNQGCYSYKNVAYFKDVPDTSRLSVQTSQYKTLRILKGDMLTVNIETIDPDANLIFNQAVAASSQLPGSPISGGSGGFASGSGSIVPTGSAYLVNDGGAIELPLLGKIYVSGLTTSVAADTIQTRVAALYKTPTVTVHFANLKVNVLGEVQRPGSYILTNEKNTILDALSMAGDLTIFGKRENILLLRDSAGVTNFIRFSLNSKSLVNKDFYFLRQNDVIYVEPSRGKAASVDAASVRNYAIITSVVTLLIVIGSRINY